MSDKQRYYNQWYPTDAAFPHQERLDAAITDPSRRPGSGIANVLTVRLLFAKEAVTNLEQYLDEANRKLRSFQDAVFGPQRTPQRPTGIQWATDESHFPAAGSASYMPVPYCRNVRPEYVVPGLPEDFAYSQRRRTLKPAKPEEYGLRTIRIHDFLDRFFSSHAAALDRFAWEVNDLYSLAINPKRLDWGALQGHKLLARKATNLADHIANFDGAARSITAYRNRYLHDGLLEIHVYINQVRDEWEILVRSDPADRTLPFNVNAANLVRRAMDDLPAFLDEAYRLMLEYLQQHGQPPW